MDANYRVSAIASHLSSSAALQGPLPSASGAQPPVRRLDQPELIKKDLKELGFTAVQVIDKESEIQALRDGIWDMLEALLPGKLSRNNPETWRDSNWPIASRGLIHRYGAPHSPVAWAGRTHPGVLKAWEIVWGTKELITSYDAVGMMRPVEVLKKLGEEVPKLGDWAHVDHDEGGEEVELIQGFLNLYESGPEDGGLVQYMGSGPAYPHGWPKRLVDDLKGARIFGRMDQKTLNESGFPRVKICAPAGAMLLWMSTQIHCNEGISPSRNLTELRPRAGLYICMCPRNLIREKELFNHILAYKLRIATGHRPYRVVAFRDKPRLERGQKDTVDWDAMARKEHQVTDDVLRLVGALPYPGASGEVVDVEKADLRKLELVWQS